VSVRACALIMYGLPTNMNASAKLLPGPMSSITFSWPDGESANNLTWPMTVTWNSSHDWPTWNTVSPRAMRRSWLPSARRCYKLGQAVARAVQSWQGDETVVMIGTGGLSHQLDGERAGFINKPFDLEFMRSLIENPTWATQYSTHELVEKAGTQGIELLMWLATRAALPGRVTQLHTNYHIPISNTAAGLMLMMNQD